MKQINLLPKIRQTELRYEAMLRSLWLVCILTVISYGLVFLAQFSLKFYLQYQAGSIKSQIDNLQSQVDKAQNNDLKTKISEVNNLILDYNNLSNNSPKWSKLIKAFAPLPPDGVRINAFTVDPQSKTIHINGISPTRDLVILLYNNILNDNKEFYGIDYPLENVARPVNINFHFTFNYRDSVVK